MSDTKQPLWGHGLDIHADAILLVSPQKTKLSKPEMRAHFQQKLFLAIKNKEYDNLSLMVVDGLFVGVDIQQLSFHLFKEYDEKLLKLFEPHMDGNVFSHQIYAYAENGVENKPLLDYLFKKVLEKKTSLEDQRIFLVGVAKQYLSDPRPIPQTVKNKALESGEGVFDYCVGAQADHETVFEVFKAVIQCVSDKEWEDADVLMNGMENASWDKVILHLLEPGNDFFVDLRKGSDFLKVISDTFNRYPFLNDNYNKALLFSEEQLAKGQEMLDQYLPENIPFDESPFWNIFVKHKPKWQSGGINEQYLLRETARFCGVYIDDGVSHNEAMMMVTDWSRAQRRFPLNEDHYFYSDKLDDFVQSEIVPKMPQQYRRCFTESILCVDAGLFFKLPYNNINKVVQKACQHDDVLFNVLEQVTFEDLKKLIEFAPELKQRRIGQLSVGDFWAIQHYARTKTLAQQMMRLHQGWFEEDSKLLDIFVRNGLSEEHKNNFEKTVLKRTLRKDDGEAGRKTRSRTKTARRM